LRELRIGVLSKYSDGATKAAEVTKMFGRAGLDMLDYLDLSNTQVAALNAEMDKLGVTMNDSGVIQAKAVSQEFNLFGLSVQGLTNKVLDAAGPALMSFVDTLASWVGANSTTIANFVSQVAGFVLGMVNEITGANMSLTTFAGSLAAMGTTALNPTETQIAALRTQLAGLNSATTAGTGSTKGATDAFKAETAAIDAQITKLKALETEQDAKFAKDMAQINAKLGAELSTMDATEKAHTIAEQQASLVTQMAAAQDALAKATAGSSTAAGDWAVNMAQAQDALAKAQTGAGDFAVQMMQAQDALTKAQAGTTDTKTGAVTIDTTSVAAAQQRLADLNATAGSDTAVSAAQQRIVDLQAQQGTAAQSQADAITAAQAQIISVTQSTTDFQTQITDDARKAQIASVQAYVAAVSKAETDAVDKKKWAENEKKVATQLSSGIAAATAKGDLTAVSDLTIQLEAVHTAITKAGLDTRNVEKQSALDKEKALIAAETAAVSGGAVDQTASQKAAIEAQIAELEKKDKADKALAAAELARTTAWEKAQGEAFGDTPTGMAGLMAGAVTAGSNLMIALKADFAGIMTALQPVLDGFKWIVDNLSNLQLGFGLFTSASERQSVRDQGGLLGQALSFVGQLPGQVLKDMGIIPKAAGGPVSANTPYIVGENRPEVFIPDRSGTIVPSVPGGGVTISPGAIVVNVNGPWDPYGVAAQQIARSLLPGLKRELSRQGVTL
jgi:hypothetical protein